jgi:hypothetical protein
MDSITTLVIGKPDKILLAKPFISQPFIIPGMPHAPSGLARNTLLRTRTTRPWMAQDTPWVASPTGINRERIDW